MASKAQPDDQLNVISTRFIRVTPKELKLLDLNARFMRHEVFQRLVENIRGDGGLTGNAPFAWRLHDDETRMPIERDGQPVYEVLSGNHRVKAAIHAGLDEIDVCITDEYLSLDRRRAIQLSHNAIIGEDDPATLKLIYDDIQDAEMRLYSGLDDKQLKLLDGVSIVAMSEAALEFQTISLTFLPHEVDQVAEVFAMARKQTTAREHWLARWGEYDRALDSIEAASEAYNVKNTATALMIVLDVFVRHMDDLADGYLDGEGEAERPNQQVPLVSVFNSTTLPADLAATLIRLLNQERGDDPIACLQKLVEKIERHED